MHTIGVILLLTFGFLTKTNCEKHIINFGFYYPFNSPEVSHPVDFKITDVLDYGIELFNDSVLGEKYEFKYAQFDTNCTAKEGNRAYIEMLQKTDYFPFIIGNIHKYRRLRLIGSLWSQGSLTQLTGEIYYRNITSKIPSCKSCDI